MNHMSAGEALGGRQTLEDEYAKIAAPEVEQFLSDVQRAALIGALSAIAVTALWGALLQRLRTRGASSTLTDSLADSPIPSVALETAQFAVATAVGAGMTAAQRRALVRESLGLEGDKIGSMTTPEGGFSWRGSTYSAIRTAATADFGDSMLNQLYAEGYTHKRWMTRYDSRVRDSHAHVDRMTVKLDEPFIVGGIPLRYPGDPMAADISEVINCRCVLIGVNFGDRPLDHPAGTEPWLNPRPVQPA